MRWSGKFIFHAQKKLQNREKAEDSFAESPLIAGGNALAQEVGQCNALPISPVSHVCTDWQKFTENERRTSQFWRIHKFQPPFFRSIRELFSTLSCPNYGRLAVMP
jgi:hypothetical protein